MSQKKKILKNSGHTPVSNEPEEEDFFIEKAISQDPSEGKDTKTNKVNPDGTELVEGRKAKAEMALEEIFTPPDVSKLRDAGEATFGPLPTAPASTLESVHGPDNRIRIMNTANYPWRAIAQLLMTAADNSQWIGTGWFIGPHTLMTAGHCVYMRNNGGWVKKILVMPGRNADQLPYKSITSSSFRSVTGWTNNNNEFYDYGAIILPTNMGNSTGWFGFGVFSDSTLKASIGNISGYPSDKTPSGTQWYDFHKIDSVNSRKVFYDIDTYGGQSGAPVYRIINGNRYGIAIHAYGGATTNSGTRIVTPVFNNMVSWKA